MGVATDVCTLMNDWVIMVDTVLSWQPIDPSISALDLQYCVRLDIDNTLLQNMLDYNHGFINYFVDSGNTFLVL